MDDHIFDLSHQNSRLASKIAAALERISHAYRKLLWEHAKELGLSPIQIQILIFVKYHAEARCNVSYLAREFEVTKPTISDAIRVLANKELIERKPSAEDKRSYAIALSPEGNRIVEQVEHYAGPVSSSIEQASEEQQKAIFSFLSGLIKQLHQTGVLTVQRNCYSCRFFQPGEKVPYCKLLQLPLREEDIRIDCPEFELK